MEIEPQRDQQEHSHQFPLSSQQPISRPNKNQQPVPIDFQIWNIEIDGIFNKNKGLSKAQIKSLKKMKVGNTTKDCSICCDNFQKDQVIYQLPCKHIFHTVCLKNWFELNVTCPMCRFTITPN